MKKLTIKFLVIALGAVGVNSAFAQNIGINTTGATPNTAAILDLNTGNSGTMGFLPPQAALTNVTVWAPITGTATVGMFVYSTTAPTGGNGVGYYYWGANSQWNYFMTGGGGGSAWLLTGNAGTTPGTNFLGTTDAAALEFKVDNQKAGWIDYTSPYNTFLGWETGNATTGTYNNAIGYQALQLNTTGSSNTAMGTWAGYTNNASQNVFVGDSAGYANTTGPDAVDIGYQAGGSNTTGADNVSIGYNAGYYPGSVNTGNDNIGIGTYAMEYWGGSATGSDNIGIGYGATSDITTGNDNIGLGNQANAIVWNGSNNIAIGYYADLQNQSASDNIAIGYQSMQSGASLGHNIAIGTYSMWNDIWGGYSVAIGDSAMTSGNNPNYDVAVGYDALEYTEYSFAYAQQDVAIGYAATQHLYIGYNNTSVGYEAMYNSGKNHTSGVNSNTAIGAQSLWTNTTGINNTASGNAALYSSITASSNTALGRSAGYANTADYNVFIGDSAGYGNTTAANDVFLGYQAGPAAPGSNTIYLGNTSTIAIMSNSVTAITAWSDRRVKDSIKGNVPGLAFITKLKPVTFHYNIAKEDKYLGIKDNSNYPGKFALEKITESGFIAQQVDSAAMACHYNFCGVVKPKTTGGLYALGYSSFVVPLVKAVQEQQQMIDSLRHINSRQQAMIESIKKTNTDIQAENKKLEVEVNNNNARITKLENIMSAQVAVKNGVR